MSQTVDIGTPPAPARDERVAQRSTLSRLLARPETGALAGAIVIFVIFFIVAPPFREASSLATVLYAGALGCLLVAPLLLIEMVAPPRAEIASITFHTPGPRGDHLPAGTVRQGVRNGSEHPGPVSEQKRSPERRSTSPTTIPVAPPESEVPEASQDPSGSDGLGDGPRKGDRGGKGTRPDGPRIGCDDCPGTGTGTDDGPETIYQQETIGLAPPQIIPSSRALPKYPDLPRKAGLQGTV